jgi:hypothetical protein
MSLRSVMKLIASRKAIPSLAINVETSTHQSADVFSASIGPKVRFQDLRWQVLLTHS